MSKISGPLLDRIDIHIEVPAVPYGELSSKASGTSSESMKEAVLEARARQTIRFAGSRTRTNAQMTSRQVREKCPLDVTCQKLLEQSVDQLGLSARAYDKVLRVSRTIADVDGAEHIGIEHISEAINYRMLDRQFWS
jgi:magnesium chelatase family protein